MIIGDYKYDDYQCEDCQKVYEVKVHKDKEWPRRKKCPSCEGKCYRKYGSMTTIPRGMSATGEAKTR